MRRRTDKDGRRLAASFTTGSAKPELLAPAGDLRSLEGAVAAGADAVYLGGQRYSARAYAGNFSDEELLQALRFAHIHGRRIYLTLNTLIKESEFAELEEYLKPLADGGLDGIIIQDLGVMAFVRDRFPEIRIHASTQTAVTGVYGARFLRSLGAERVVPARELSLRELRRIKTGTDDGEGGIEIEAFIHGAMCFSYSGMCLMSSMIGGRSGNRGRCAGACRLPYRLMEGSTPAESYPLSLRDMCTLPLLKKLIMPEKGIRVIDSLKIEGRMKDASYAAGVTDVYRRAIDRIFERPDEDYDPGDLETLKGLYLRTELCDGYFFRHNSREMMTGSTPGYTGCDERIKKLTEERFLSEKPRVDVSVRLRAVTSKPLELEITAHRDGGDEVSVTEQGPEVSEARNDGATEESLRKQLDRFGESWFDPRSFDIDTDGRAFVPASVLNGLRRTACSRLEMKLAGGAE